MEPIRQVMAATDFSSHALPAVHRAASICSRHQAGMQLVHVLDGELLLAVRNLLHSGGDLEAAVASQARTELGALAEILQRQHAVVVQQALRQGALLQEVLAAAAGVDLLVLGARGQSALRDLALGTLPERLARSAPCPLLVVRQPPGTRYDRVLVPVDFSSQSRQALQAAMRLVPDASFHLLHCYRLPHEGQLRIAGVADADIERHRRQAHAAALAQFDDFLRGLPSRERLTLSVRNGDPRFEVLRQAQDERCQLVAIGKQGRSVIGDALLGSTTQWVLANGTVDVLVVPAAQAGAAS